MISYDLGHSVLSNCENPLLHDKFFLPLRPYHSSKHRRQIAHIKQNVSVVYAAVWRRWTGQNSPLRLCVRDDRFSLHPDLGQDDVLQRSLVG